MDDDLVAMPVVDQDGEVFVGPGAKKEAQLLGLGLRKLKSREKDDVSQAKRYAMELSTKKVMEEQHEAHLKNQQRQSMYCQALALMGRVYIGSISMEVREHDLRKAFENFGPVKNINMSYDGSTGNHKGFAFLEYEVPEAAVIGVDAMNGLYMGGRNLKVGRPANMPQAQPIIDMIMTDATRYNRVYVASVHPDLSETDLKSVFEAFGTVTKCQLARNSATGKGAHRGFGYLEFSTREASKEAITGMNMFDLGGQFLRVGKCITPPEALNYLMPQTSASLPSAAAMAAASITAKIQASEVVQKKKLAIEGTKSSPTQAAKHAAPLHTAIGMDSVNGLYVTANLPIGPSPCMELTSSTVLPPHLQAVAAPPPAQLMLGYTPANEEAVPSPPQQGGGFGQPPPPPPYPGMPPPPPAFMPPPPPGFAGPVPPPPPQWGAVPPPPPPSQSRRTGFGGFADSPAGTDTPPGAPPTQGSSSIGLFDPMKGAIYATCMEEDEPAKKKKKKEKGRSNLSVMERIQVPDLNHSTVASFGELEEHLRYKDPSLETEEEPLAILGAKEGDVQAMALALLDGNKALVTAHNRREEKRKQDEKALMANQPGKAKIKKPKKQKKGPKLNTAKELDAAVRAGNITTTIVNTEASSEEASIASQERGQTIRGNDARYSLMTKLMKTTRSNVIMLKNMVTPDDIDEFLEDEIKEECGKYGNVEEVVIVSDPDAGTAKVFVQFRDHGEADEAKKGLHDRFFAGRNIAATSYDQIMFEHGDFTG